MNIMRFWAADISQRQAKKPAPNIKYISLILQNAPINTKIARKINSTDLNDFLANGNIAPRIIAMMAGLMP